MGNSSDSSEWSEEPVSKPRREIRCKRCRCLMTWADQRKQFGRMIGRGLTTEEAKTVQPRCQKCVTVYLREREPGMELQNNGKANRR